MIDFYEIMFVKVSCGAWAKFDNSKKFRLFVHKAHDIELKGHFIHSRKISSTGNKSKNPKKSLF